MYSRGKYLYLPRYVFDTEISRYKEVLSRGVEMISRTNVGPRTIEVIVVTYRVGSLSEYRHSGSLFLNDTLSQWI